MSYRKLATSPSIGLVSTYCKLEKEMNSATNTEPCFLGNRPSNQYVLRGITPVQTFIRPLAGKDSRPLLLSGTVWAQIPLSQVALTFAHRSLCSLKEGTGFALDWNTF